LGVVPADGVESGGLPLSMAGRAEQRKRLAVVVEGLREVALLRPQKGHAEVGEGLPSEVTGLTTQVKRLQQLGVGVVKAA
jgi:hypothetical protein